VLAREAAKAAGERAKARHVLGRAQISGARPAGHAVPLAQVRAQRGQGVIVEGCAHRFSVVMVVLLRRRGRRCPSVRAPARHHLADRGHQRAGEHVLVDEHVNGAVGHHHAVGVLDPRTDQDDLRLR
jgi:hypothetical protein